MEISLAQLEDYEALHKIVREGHEEHVEALPYVFQQTEEVMPLSYFQELLDDVESDIIVVKQDGKVIGFAVVGIQVSPTFSSMTPRKYAYVHDMGVSGEHQRKGVGRVLLDTCKQWAIKNQAQSLELKVWTFNTGAVALYENFGMKKTSQVMSLRLDE